ncbi:hypothetical protein E2C01_054235 [Portunus trituberculatus]|uniref:Uncharacterized protein n=1 Tax=Portunus trituberculatus TaxID=210409 RepID=A0A5B7GSN3_PORTR|nr:hypothetical protein [Portunus trituberculatus]
MKRVRAGGVTEGRRQAASPPLAGWTHTEGLGRTTTAVGREGHGLYGVVTMRTRPVGVRLTLAGALNRKYAVLYNGMRDVRCKSIAERPSIPHSQTQCM